MADREVGIVLRHIRRMVGLERAATRGDGELLARFVAVRDEEAFEALVRRHGRLVFGVCRRVLGNRHDAEDAFQATFLVLARKAGSIRKSDSVGSWLYGVAYRVAVRARSESARRRRTEQTALPQSLEPPEMDIDRRDLRAVLDAELNRLPRKYREALVLCDLEGKSHVRAAEELGWPTGTMSRRLERGRELLRQRLTSRGIGLPGGMLVAALAEEAAASVSPLLLSSTAKAGLLFAAGPATVAGVVSANVTGLAHGALQAMMISKLKMVGLVLLAVSAVGLGAGLVGSRSGAIDAAEEPKPEVAAAVKATIDLKPLYRVRLDTADIEFNARIREFLAGRGTLDIMLASSRHLFEAKLDLCADEKEKIDVYEQYWRSLKLVERVNRARYTAGRIPIQDYYQSRYSRIQAEILLAKANVKPPSGSIYRGNRLDNLGEIEDAEIRPDDRLIQPRQVGNADSFLSLQQIRLALREYYLLHDHYPPPAIYGKDGKPLLSWRVIILPYLMDDDTLFKKFKLDERWDSPHNERLLAEMPEFYAPGEDTDRQPIRAEPNMTFYRAFVGKGTAFEGKEGMSRKQLSDRFILTIVEAAEAVPWTTPFEELVYDEAKPLPKLGASGREFFPAIFVNDGVRYIRKDFDQKVLRQAIRRNDGLPNAKEEFKNFFFSDNRPAGF